MDRNTGLSSFFAREKATSPPGMPVHGIMGVLEKVRTTLADQVICEDRSLFRGRFRGVGGTV